MFNRKTPLSADPKYCERAGLSGEKSGGVVKMTFIQEFTPKRYFAGILELFSTIIVKDSFLTLANISVISGFQSKLIHKSSKLIEL